MAQETSNFYRGLRRLFSNNVIVRYVGKKKIKVIDTDGFQMRHGESGKYSRMKRSPRNLPDPWDDRLRGDTRTRKSWKNRKAKKQWMKQLM